MYMFDITFALQHAAYIIYKGPRWLNELGSWIN